MHVHAYCTRTYVCNNTAQARGSPLRRGPGSLKKIDALRLLSGEALSLYCLAHSEFVAIKGL